MQSAESEKEFFELIDKSYLESIHLYTTGTAPRLEPTRYDQAIAAPDSDKWWDAMRDEIESLNKLGVWEVVPRPENRKVIGCKWVYRIKTNAQGEVERYKARLVAKGYSQVPGMDFSDTFAPVTRLETIRLMLAIAVQRDWEIRQIDVKTAYLHGELDEEIFMEPPKGFPVPNGHVYRLKKALYGLKQAGRQWYFKLKSVLNEFGFTQIECEPHTFVVRKVVDGIERTLVLPVYVDDLLPIGDKVLTDEFERNIGKYFDVTLSGDASYFLGIQLQRDRLADPLSLILNQHKFVQDILHRIDHDGSTTTTPLSLSTKLVENPSPKEDAN